MPPQSPAEAWVPVPPAIPSLLNKELFLPCPAILSRLPTPLPARRVLHSAHLPKGLISGIPTVQCPLHNLRQRSPSRLHDDNVSLQKTSEWDFLHISHSPFPTLAALYVYAPMPYTLSVRKKLPAIHIPDHQSQYVHYNLFLQSPIL